MKHLNFLSKSSSRSCGHRVTTLASTVGSPSAHRRGAMLRLISVLVLIFTFGIGQMWGISVSDISTTAATSLSDGGTYVIATAYDGTYLTTGVSSGWGGSTTTASDAAIFTAHGSASGFYLTCSSGRLVPATSNTFPGYDNNSSNNLSLSNAGSIQNSSSTGRILRCAASGFRWYSSNTGSVVYLFEVSSCSGTQLGTPNVTATPSSGQVRLTWPNVANATKYQVSWNGGAFADATSPYTKNSLSNGTTYTWAVKAIGDGSNYCDSDPTEGSTKAGTAYAITWKVNGETYKTTYVSNGDNLVLPANPDICKTGTEFVGWSVSTISGTTNTKPTFVSSQTTISSAQTYHAVFATKTTDSYTKGDINDLRPGQSVLIVNTQNSTSKALSKAVVSGQTNKRLQSVGVAPDAYNVISPMNNANLIWTVENSGTKYNFKIGSKYLRATGSGQDKLAYGDDADLWTLTASSGTYLMKSNNSSTYYIEFYNTYFTTYSSNNPGAAYKMTFYVPTYSGYFTSCCTSLGSINGSVSLSQKSATLSWDLASAQNGGKAHITSWKVEYKLSSADDWTVAESELAKATLTKTISDLNCNTDYDFRVSANVQSGYCDIVKEWTSQKTTKFTITKDETGGGGITLSPTATSVCDGDVIDVTANTPDGSHEGTGTIKVIETGSDPENDVTSTVYNQPSAGKLTMPAYDITITATYAEKQSPSITIKNIGGDEITELDFGSEVKQGSTPVAQSIKISGSQLTSGTLSLSLPENSNYTLSQNSISVGGTLAETTITVTPKTSSYGTFNETLTISGGGLASNVEISLELTVLQVFTVNWYVNGGSTPEHSQTDVANTAYDEVPSDFSAFDDCKDGLTFIGWSETAFGSTTSAPSLASIGTKITANKNYYAVFADGTPGSTNKLFEETFAESTGTAGWSSTAANGTIAYDNEGWSADKAYGNGGSAKFGTGSAKGYAITPAINVDGSATLTFKSGAWSDDKTTDGLVLSVEEGTATLTPSTLSLTNASWNANEVAITNADGPIKIKFSAAQDSKNRFFLDDVVVSQEVAANWTKWYTTCPHYYAISLTNEGVVDGKGSFAADKASALEGESVQLTATGTTNAGRFNSWSITGLDSYSATTNPLTITMPDNDITVSATFDALYAITKELVHGTFNLDKNYAIAGETVTISNVAADAQYKNPVITVFKTGDESTTVSVIAGAFTMPAYPVMARVVCEPAIEPLDAPVLGEATDATYQGVTLNWTGVAGNEGYVLTVQQGGVDVEGLVNVAIAQNATSYTIASGLAANTAYTYSIYTKGNGTTTMEVNTPANGNFSTVDYPNVTFYYSENGTLSAGESKKILTDFELADPVSDPCTKKFVGWSTETVAETDVEPAMMAPGATYQIPTNANCTIYAVYATEVPGDEIWTETAISDLAASDVVVIVGDNGDTYAMTNDNGTGSAPAAVNVTVSSSNLTGTIAANVRWNISKNGSNYTIYPNGTTETWLYCTNTNNGVRVGTSTDNKIFTVNEGYLYNTGTSRYVGIYNNSDWRCYTLNNSNQIADNIKNQTFKYYKRGVGDPTYSAYATTCTGKVKTPSFSGVTDSETYEENKTVSLGCATDEATIRYTMSNDGTTPADPTGESTAATSISLNADGVYVIKAKAFKDGMDASDVATITVTINKPCTTIAQYLAAAPESDKKLVFTSESNAVVLGVNANRIYIQDLTGGLLLYQTEHGKTWTKGMKVVGTVIGSYAEVDNTPRMVVSDISGLQASSYGVMPSPEPIDGAINAENFAANRNKLVTVNSLHFQSQSVGGGYSINITRGEDTYQIYNAFNALNDHVLPLTETACSVTGILGYHSNKYQLMPIEANCITTGATAVLPEFVGETGGADAEHPTEVASGEVIKLTAAEGMTSNYTIGEGEPVTIATNTEAVISGSNEDLIAITISASREYYATNSVTYYYKINNALTKYIITSAVAENGTFKVKNSDASAEITSAVAGVTVTLVAEPTHTETAQYSLDHWTVYETGNTSNTVSVENNQFEMPSFAVTVSATFAEDAYATVVFDGGDATGTAPASEKKYVGQEVTMPNKGALVKADHVLASWTYNEAEYAVGDTYEIQAGDAAIGGKNITFTANWTAYPWANGGDWMLVTDAAEVTAGSYVIIAAAASNVAISTTQNNNNRAQQSISKSDNRLTYGETAPAIFEVRAGNIENTLAFYDVVNEGYIYAAGGGNYLRTQDDLSNKSSWNIEITNAGEATILANDVTQNSLRYNSTNNPPIFSCYESGQKAIALYKYYAPVPKVTYDKNTTDEVTNMPNPSVQRAENNKAVIAAGPSRTGYTFEGWKNGNTTYTVGEEYTFTEDITLYAQWAALPSFHVTYNTSGSQGTTPTDATNYYEGDKVTLAPASGLSNAGYFFAGWNDGTSTYPAGSEYDMPASDVTFTSVWSRESAQKWALVEQGDELVIGGEYIIASTVSTNTYALGDIITVNSSKVGQPLDVNRNGNIIKGSEAMVVYTLVAGNGDNTYAFKNSDNDYLMWSSGNTLNKTDELNNTSSWKISIGDGNIATIKNVGDETRKMQYNSSQPRFACYSSTGQKDVQLFKKVALAEISTAVDASTLDDNTDVIVHENGVLTIDENKQIGDLTVENGGQVVLDANKLTVVGTFTIETTMASGKSGQMKGATSTNFATTGEAYIDITLGDNGNPEKWHAFTVPFPVDAINGIYDLDGNKLTNEVNYAIMDYHGDIRATGNYGWKKYRKTLVPGTFYLMTVDGLRTTYRFKKTADGALVAGNTKALTAYSGGGAETDQGWNGVGNPTMVYGTVDQKVQVLNPSTYTYEQFLVGAKNFVVGTPFFVQATTDGTMTMGAVDGEKPYYAPARVQANEIKDIEVTFGNEEYSDRLYISASEEALNEYQIGKDLVKMTMTSTPKVAQIFGKAYNSKLCMVYAPMANDQAEVALELYAPQAGEYTIGAPSMDNADLYLTYEGSIIWNLSMGEYTVDLNKGTTNGYGLLLQAKAPQVTTGVDQLDNGDWTLENVQKVIIDEHVFILRGGQMYDVTGKAVK